MPADRRPIAGLRLSAAWVGSITITAVLVAACSSSPHDPAQAAPTGGATATGRATTSQPAASPGVAGQPSGPAQTAAATVSPPPCPPDPIATPTERPGAGAGATFWALIHPVSAQLESDVEIEIDWRMTGSGALSIVATGPLGRSVMPFWGPNVDAHSPWSRPGDEWSTGWIFPTPGCWTVRAQRADGSSGAITLRLV
jgi:hypothetical protein